MGGTSFDAALVIDGEPALTTASRVNRYALALPTMDINTIGAGGGSIAWLDDGGLLHMGPQSAGAAPGPACYGRGGVEPTCTDANLVLGYLSAGFFAGGRMPLDPGAAERAIRERIAKPLHLSAVEAAAGMFQVINVNMAAAIREISVQKGHDPRDFPLILAGGAGPVHGAAIALELGIPHLVVPRDAAIFCAAGMLRTDFKHDFVRSYAHRLPDNKREATRVRRLARDMEREAHALLRSEKVPRDQHRLRYRADLRYLGQYHELSVALSEKQLVEGAWGSIREAFHRRHDQLYGYSLADDGTPVELLNLRLSAIGLTEKAPLPRLRSRGSNPSHAKKGTRPVYLAERRAFAAVPVYDGDRLHCGNTLAGPAIIESINTTIVVPREFRAAIDSFGNCVMTARNKP
jgi:N-methylhydantoinase A